ncbi:hypothetical protein [Burkholderia cepacia]|uniref:hypothetical protein n=1 Tax=Burkholderia cepacia TaxID=292 RepID=UPI001F17B91A|nr:hypothetical protein [Burkholderia cepacia]MCE4125784.1 hypothetical protein [Burkholderia cepacia]
MKYDAPEYVRWDPFEGDEAEISCRQIRIVRVRKEHPCFIGANPCGGDQHVIKVGEMARYEKAFVDGSFWGRSYVCIPCMDKFLDELKGEGYEI